MQKFFQICAVFAGSRVFRVCMHLIALLAVLPAVQGATLGRARFTWEAVADSNVAGYRVHWGTASGVYTRSFDAGNTTEVVIGEFVEGAEYFSAITAYGSSGEESAYSDEISFTYDSVDRMILLEAESGELTAPMQVFSDTSTFWVAAATADPNASVALDFTVPYATDFFVWCRVLAPSASQDSFLVAVDQQVEQVYDVYGEPSPPAEVFKSDWTWSRIQISPGTARAYTLESGAHRIRFRYLENVQLDRVVIVSNPDFVPTDDLPRSGDFVEVVAHPQDARVATGGAATFSATFVSTGPLNLQWRHDGVLLDNATQQNLSLTNLQTSDSGTYWLSALRGTASATTRPATLSVVPADGTSVFRVRNMSVTSDGQVTFEFAGAVGSEIGVYVSTDLVNWTLLSTHANTGPTLTINDSGAVGSAKRFYRLADTAGP